MEKFNKKRSDEAFEITTNDWATQSNKLKEKYSILTDADLKYETGNENVLLKRLETKLKKNRAEVINIIKEVQQIKSTTIKQ